MTGIWPSNYIKDCNFHDRSNGLRIFTMQTGINWVFVIYQKKSQNIFRQESRIIQFIVNLRI